MPPRARRRSTSTFMQPVLERIQRGRRRAPRSRAPRPGGSGSRPRTPPCRAASGASMRALAGHDRERSAHRGVEADRVEHERGARVAARRRQTPTARRPARRPRRPSAPHRDRARWRFAPAAPMRPAAARACSTSSGEAPFCGAKVRAAPSGPQHRDAHVARDREPHAAQCAAQLAQVGRAGCEVRSERLQRSAAAVGRGAAADGRPPPRARRRRWRPRSARRCRGSRPPPRRARRRAGATARTPGPARRPPTRPPSSIAERRPHLAPERVGCAARPGSGRRERAHDRLHRALAAVGDRQQRDLVHAARQQPAADRGRHLARHRACP